MSSLLRSCLGSHVGEVSWVLRLWHSQKTQCLSKLSVPLTLLVFPPLLPQQPLSIRCTCTVQVLISHFDWSLGIRMAEWKTIKMQWEIITKRQSPESHSQCKIVGSQASSGKLFHNWSMELIWDVGVLEKVRLKAQLSCSHDGQAWKGWNTSSLQLNLIIQFSRL